MDHFKDNPKRIDKLIAVKGLPKEWMFHDSPEGIELKRPWEPDIDKNIPQEVRHLCEPMYVILRYAPISRDVNGVLEKRQIWGVRLDYNTEPGRQMWDDVERYIDESMPRGERLPIPVVCSRDERSGFETFTPRRNSRGSLEMVASPVPFVDLTKYQEVRAEPVTIPSAESVLKTEAPEEGPATPPDVKFPEMHCEVCQKVFIYKKFYDRHMKGHQKEKVGV